MAEPMTDGSPDAPKVSVVMAVYNGMPYLPEAIDSILGQTFGDFEFVIVDDCSTDETPRVLAEYAQRDPRIRVITNSANLGVAASLAAGVEAALGEYVARIDADDWYHPSRLEKMVTFLDEHPEAGVLGTSAWIVDGAGETICQRDLLIASSAIKAKLRSGNCMFYAVLMRKELAVQVGNYRSAFRIAEDYDLWLRMSERSDISNLPEPLLFYRQSAASVTVRQSDSVRKGFLRLARELASQRRRTGRDSYDEYVENGLFPELDASARGTPDKDHLKLAKYAMDSGFFSEALHQTWRAFRASPLRIFACFVLLVRLTAKRVLIWTGLFRWVKKVVYGRDE